MIEGTLSFEMMDYWRCGAGHGAGRFLDAVVIKTPAGLPTIPGRTVKGLCRDVVRQAEGWGHLAPGTTELLFGSAPQQVSRFETEAGILRFCDATLPEPWEAYISQDNRSLANVFFEQIATTSLDEHRVAAEHSLRRVEVAVPCTLYAPLYILDDAQLARAQHALNLTMPLLRHMGSGRHRGFGLVKVNFSLGGS